MLLVPARVDHGIIKLSFVNLDGLLGRLVVKLPPSTGQSELLDRSFLVVASLIQFLHRVMLSQSCSVICN